MKNLLSIVVFLFFSLHSTSQVTVPVIDAAPYRELIRPPKLEKGDTVMIIAPAGIMKDTASVMRGIALLEDWGLNYKLGKNIFKQNYHFAGTDEERLADIQEALDDDNVKAIWCARGGYGTIRIIDDIDFTRFKQHPKWIIGFSDITVLHNEVHNMGIETMHALMPITYKPDSKEQKKAVKSLKRAVFDKRLKYKISDSEYNREGEATGEVVGGNLSLVYSMLGSRSQISADGKILFLEEVGEALYHIDRMMISLKRAGYFENCKGLIIGGISDIKENSTPFGITYQEIILDAVKDYDFPVCFDFPAGHITDNRTLLLGREIELDVRDNKAVIKFEK
ncbi:MAG: LD-carboxypeptidase [Flavobacteriaceae bacterium]|nr:LD-carboxypeptidase [Flavobacteriaceae bacterium]